MRPTPITPGAGQISVWDFPRPPALEPESRTIRVVLGDRVVAQTTRGFRTLETSHPPVYYVPSDDVRPGFLAPSERMRDTVCEFKGVATYYALAAPHARELRQLRTDVATDPAAWSYPEVVPSFEPIRGYIGFYARVFDCFVGDEKVAPQEGEFYGGWITKELVGPFKGGPGTWGW